MKAIDDVCRCIFEDQERSCGSENVSLISRFESQISLLSQYRARTRSKGNNGKKKKKRSKLKKDSVEELDPSEEEENSDKDKEKKKKKHLKRNICERYIEIVVDQNTLEQEEREKLISEDEKVSVSDVFWKGKERFTNQRLVGPRSYVLKRYIDMCIR
ncbi:hypothetical protein Tco_0997448 [Tanacetum coccineum]